MDSSQRSQRHLQDLLQKVSLSEIAGDPCLRRRTAEKNCRKKIPDWVYIVGWDPREQLPAIGDLFPDPEERGGEEISMTFPSD